MTYALREACSRAAHALAAPIAPVIALMTPAALGLSGDPVHEPVHALKLAPCGLHDVTAAELGRIWIKAARYARRGPALAPGLSLGKARPAHAGHHIVRRRRSLRLTRRKPLLHAVVFPAGPLSRQPLRSSPAGSEMNRNFGAAGGGDPPT